MTGKIFFFLIVFASIACHRSKQGRQNSNEVWLDRFDSTNGSSLTGAHWYTLNDQSNGGASSITPGDIKMAYLSIPERGNNRAFRFNCELHKGDFKWPYVGFGISIDKEKLQTGINSLQGIAYEFKGKGHTFNFQTSEVKDYAHYQKPIYESEEWVTVVIPFNELKQPPWWGKHVEFDASTLEGLTWVISGKDGDTGEIYIDNIRFLKKLPPSPEENNMPSK